MWGNADRCGVVVLHEGMARITTHDSGAEISFQAVSGSGWAGQWYAVISGVAKPNMQVPTDYVVQMDVCLSQWGYECETEDFWLFWLLDVVFGCLVRWENNPVIFDRNDLDDAWKR
jgi:hypothetical protein